METILRGANNMDTEKCCYNCAFCSIEYPSLRDICDKTEEYIADVYSECCGMFVPMNGEEDQ